MLDPSNPGTYMPPGLGTSQVATAAAVARQSHKLKLLSQHDMTPEEVAMEKEEMGRKGMRRTIFAVVAAGIAMLTAGAAIVIEGILDGGLFIYLAMAFPLTTAPYTVHQRRKLNRLPTLRKEHNRIRVQVNRMQAINNELTENVTKLERQVQRLQGIEYELEMLCAQQGQDVSELQGLIRQNGVVMREIKKAQETEIMQNVLKAVIASDRSGDWHIDDSEMDLLIMRLRALPAVSDSVSERTLRTSLQLSPSTSMASLYQVTADLMNEEKLQLGQSMSG